MPGAAPESAGMQWAGGGQGIMPFSGYGSTGNPMLGGLAGNFGESGFGGPQRPSNYASYQTGGYGAMPASASPLSQAYQSAAGEAGYGSAQGGGIWGGPAADYLRGLGTQSNIKLQGERQQREEGLADVSANYQRRSLEHRYQMGQLQEQVMQRLLSLFGGIGQRGGPGGVGLPISTDPTMRESGRAQVAANYEPIQRRLTANLRGRGLAEGTSSEATTQQGMLAGRMSRDMLAGELPAMQASVAAYQPGLEQQGLLYRLLASVLGGGMGGGNV